MPPDKENDPEHEDELDAARRLLRHLIRVQEVNLQDLDKRFGYTRGYVSRLLHGDTRLTYQHVLQILKAIDVEPALYFSTLHPQRQLRRQAEAERIEELRTLIGRLGRLLPIAGEVEVLAPTPSADEDIDTRIQEAVRTVLARRQPRRSRRNEES
jgi:hypothetical protein